LSWFLGTLTSWSHMSIEAARGRVNALLVAGVDFNAGASPEMSAEHALRLPRLVDLGRAISRQRRRQSVHAPSRSPASLPRR
jgi:hypothetical protein